MRVAVRCLLNRIVLAMAVGVGLLVAVTIIWLAAVLALGFDAAPAVRDSESFAPQDIERALALFKRHDPRWQRPGVVRAVVAEERDLNLLFAHLASRMPGFRGRIALAERVAELRLSIDIRRFAPAFARLLPDSHRRPWLNLQAHLVPGDRVPMLRDVSAGVVPIPVAIAERVFAEVLHRTGDGIDAKLLHDVLRQVRMQPHRLLVFYAWQNDTGARLLNALTSVAERGRLRDYNQRLAQWSQRQAWATPARLETLLPMLFELARARSNAGMDAVAENRAALLTASLYANRRPLSSVVTEAQAWPRPRWITLTLAGRTDTPLHYLISASLAAESGTPLSDAVGLYKELADSRGGSGFSFHDLAADRAGTRMGEAAAREPKRLQAYLARPLTEADLLPDIADLPESMSEAQFETRFGGVGAPAYMRMLAEIEARLDRLPWPRTPRP